LPGILVLIIDISKGLIAAAVLPDFLGLSKIIYRVIFALLAVVGHIWTVFLKFKGGKGVATTLGILLGLALKIASLRLVVFLSLLTWIIVFVLSGFVSLASILTAVLTPIYMLIFYQGIEIVSLGIILCLIIICRHISNIKRLLNKEESRVNILSRKRP
jgi:glycerol-3-phosphate acyltransferase PlsY